MQGKSLAYNLGFSDGFIREKVPGPHTSNYTKGYEQGLASYQEIKGAIIPGYLNRPMIPAPSFFNKNETEHYVGWYQQARHFHDDDKFTISIPSHSNDNYLMYIIGIQDGMGAYDADDARGNGNINPPLGHPYQSEYNAGFNDGYSIEHQAEDAD